MLQPENEAIGELTYERNSRRIYCSGEELDFPRRERVLFETLLMKQGQFVSKSVLADTLYGVGSDIDLNAVELSVSRLRRLIKNNGVVIRTARGIGYMMEAESLDGQS